MKIYIITIHCIHNFGSVYQSYGLVKYLCDLGYDAKIIDYRPFYYRKGRNIIKKIAGIVLNYFAYTKQLSRYNTFITQELPKTEKTYTTLDQLKDLEDEDAIFISGGDQLWNSFHPCGKDDAYKLTFIKKGKKIAYGTSMGRNSFTKKELEELSRKTRGFYNIGLREQSTVSMLQPFTNVPVYHAADPVLLLDKDDYMECIGKIPLIKEPYLIMYLADKSSLLGKTIEYIARTKGLKTVHVCGFRKKCKCDYFFKSTGPKELLNLIYYSDFVVSASFHATLFSILFQKQFCTLLPEVGTNTRIEDLLSYFELQERIIHTSSDLRKIDVNIDFNRTIKLKKTFVDSSKEKLKTTIENLLL